MKTLNEWQHAIALRHKNVESAIDLVTEYGYDFDGVEMDLLRRTKADLLDTYEDAFKDIITHPITLPSLEITVIYTEQKTDANWRMYIAEMDELPEWAITDAVAEKMVDYFIQQLTPFGVSFSTFIKAELTLESDFLGELVFTNSNDYEIHISKIWFDHTTGEIQQYGTNHGHLTL